MSMTTRNWWIRRLFTSSVDYPILGRWSLQYSDKIVNRKIDLANEDHCGCCVPTPTVVKTNVEKVEIEEEYYMPFLY